MSNNHSPPPVFTEVLVAISMVVLVLFGEWLGLVQPFNQALSFISRPILVRLDALVFQATQPLTLIPVSFKAARRVQQLEYDYSQALAEIAALKELEAENQLLRDMLQAAERPTAAVIAAPISAHGQPSLAVGSSHGVELGQSVVAAQTLVGVIAQVQPHQAQVKLLTELRNEPILAKTDSGIKGLIKGDGRQLLLTELPPEAEVKPGEKVVTLGQSQVRSGIFIGQVQQLLDQPSTPVKTAVIEQQVSFYEVGVVEVWP